MTGRDGSSAVGDVAESRRVRWVGIRGAGLALSLLAAASVPRAAAAQEPAPPQAPAAEPPPSRPAPSTLPDPAEQRRNNAAKLAGMVRFVAAACPDLKPDYALFRQAVAALNVDLKDLENGPLTDRSLGYARAYRDSPDGCTRVLGLFGEGGRVIPNLIARAKPAAPDK